MPTTKRHSRRQSRAKRGSQKPHSRRSPRPRPVLGSDVEAFLFRLTKLARRELRRRSRLSPEAQIVLEDLRADPDRLARTAAKQLREVTGIDHFDVCVVAGSGWDVAAKKFGQRLHRFEATRFAGFLPTTVKGHAGIIEIYKIGRLYVLVFRGRKHLYEFKEHEPGMDACMHYVRVAHFTKCRIFIHTNAVGGLRPDLRVGQAVIVRSHNKLIGGTPSSLRGKRFLDCSKLYNALLRKLCLLIDPTLVEGIIAQVCGPEFETPEDAEYLAMHGITVVGMSMIPENLLANYYGIWFLGISVVTDAAGTKVSHKEVLAVLKRQAPKYGAFIYTLIRRLPQQRRKTFRPLRRKAA